MDEWLYPLIHKGYRRRCDPKAQVIIRSVSGDYQEHILPDQDFQGSLRFAALASSRPCAVRSFRLASGCSIRHPRSPRERRATRKPGLIGIASAALLPVARCSVPSIRQSSSGFRTQAICNSRSSP